MDITLKIGTRSETVQVPEANLQGILTPNEVSVALTGEAEVWRALNEPIGTPRLRDIVHPGEKIAIITSDITRPMPTWKVMPPCWTSCMTPVSSGRTLRWCSPSAVTAAIRRRSSAIWPETVRGVRSPAWTATRRTAYISA